MSEQHPHTSRFGLILTLVAIGGSAVGVIAWQFFSNKSAGLDTSGFDVATTIETPVRAAAAALPSAPAAPAVPTSLGMVKGDAGMSVLGPGASTPTKPKEDSGSKSASSSSGTFDDKAAWVKHHDKVTNYILKMQAKYPSITQYGKDWMKYPDLRDLRNQYHADHDATKFALGVAKSENFGKLVKQYAGDPGIKACLIGGLKEAPGDLIAGAGGAIMGNDAVKSLVTSTLKAAGIPSSLVPFLNGTDEKPPDANTVMKDIMNNNPQLQKMSGMANQNAPVSLDQKDIDKAKEQVPNNGFTPLGGRK